MTLSTEEKFTWRGRPVNAELASRYGRWHYSSLENQVKSDAASAAKLATQLAKLSTTFDHVLGAPERLALQAAAQVSSALASDLKRLRPWASAYSRFSEEQAKRANEQRLIARSLEWWPRDEDVLTEASDLVAFFETGAAGDDVDAFLLERVQRAYTKVRRTVPSGNADLALRQLPGLLTTRTILGVRRCAAEVVDEVQAGFPGYDGTWFAGREDYLAWRQARSQARTSATRALAALGR